MKLDFISASNSYVLTVPQGTDLQPLMRDHGFDFSIIDSTPKTAVLFTHDIYAAAYFAPHATPRAKEKMSHVIQTIDASWALDSARHIEVPADQELWGFQKASVAYALDRKHTLIGDEPGLGKTPIAVAFANEIQAQRVLVICPASIRVQWVEKIRLWTTLKWPNLHIHMIGHGKHGVHPYAQWTVVSYELARNPAIQRAIASGRYDVLILDEAHYLKTWDAQRTRAVFGGGADHSIAHIAGQCDRVLALTGTPLPNRPREAYTLARHLDWGCIDWMSEESFRYRFNPAVQMETEDGRIFTKEDTGRHAELQARLRSHIMVRHLKREVQPQLKLPRFDMIHLDDTKPAVKAALQAESLLKIDPEAYDDEGIPIDGQVSVVRHQMGLAIAPQVADYIDMLIDGGEDKLVVFAWHRDVIDYLMHRWEKHGFLRVDGSTSPTNKRKLVNDFRTNRRHKGILGNLLSLGTGVDGLQDVASHALNAEPSWTPGENIQAFDRLDRMGQTCVVQGDIFVVPGSLGEKIVGRSLRKLQVQHKALDRRIA